MELRFSSACQDNLAAIKFFKAKIKTLKLMNLGMNHLFKNVKRRAFSEYGEIEQTISPKVLDKMSSWILKL
jgi:hypothetical protein